MPKKSVRNPGYSALGPYRAQFEAGVPTLVYHKLGPLPQGANMKSLYVDARLFAWQMRELKRAGFSTDTLGGWRGFSNPAPPRFVLTFDDGSRTVMRHAMAVLDANKFKAIQFIVAGEIGGTNRWDIRENNEAVDPLMDAADIREWLAAGHEIGAHTLTHPRLPQIPEDQAREEISASKKSLEDKFGLEIRHFCYPYGKWNRRVRDLVEQAGFETAVTLNFGVNGTADDPMALRRIGVWHPPRNFRTFVSLLFAGFPMQYFRKR